MVLCPEHRPAFPVGDGRFLKPLILRSVVEIAVPPQQSVSGGNARSRDDRGVFADELMYRAKRSANGELPCVEHQRSAVCTALHLPAPDGERGLATGSGQLS